MANVRAGERADADRYGVAGGVARFGMQQRGALGRRGDRIEHGRELLEVDSHAASRLARGGPGRRRDSRHHVADEARRIGEHLLILHLAAVAPDAHHVLR